MDPHNKRDLFHPKDPTEMGETKINLHH